MKSSISTKEISWYKKTLPNCKIVFDVGCKYDSPFYELNPNLDLHLFDVRGYSSFYSHGKFNQIALSNQSGVASYNPAYESIIKRDPSEHPFRAREWASTPSYEVKTTTLKEYCDNLNITYIDLLKTDTEGNDYNVLLGAGNLIKKIKYIQWEEWGSSYNYGNTMHKDIINLLTKTGFKLHPLGGRPRNWVGIKAPI